MLEDTYSANDLKKRLGMRTETINDAMDKWTQTKGAEGLAYFWIGKRRRVRESRVKAWPESLERETAAV